MSTSLRARAVSAFTRLAVRREQWGDERALARRARRLFGTPKLLQRRALDGARQESVAVSAGARSVRGEWVWYGDRGEALDGIVMYVHGGGYVSCSAATHRPVVTAIARKTGRRVFAVDYRLAPESRFPAALDDVVAGYRWLLDTEPGVPIAIAGESAGGGLVLALAMAARDARWTPPAGIVSLSPWTDLAATGASIEGNDGRCAMFRPRNMTDFARAYLGDASPRDPRASPLYGDPRGLPPTLIHVGSTELLLDDARRMHDRLREAGTSSTLRVYEEAMHGWHLLAGVVPEADDAIRDVAQFIDEVLTAQAHEPLSSTSPVRTRVP